jgi:hypothetical protein
MTSEYLIIIGPALTASTFAMAYLWLGRRPAADERERAVTTPSPSQDQGAPTADTHLYNTTDQSESRGDQAAGRRR